VELQAVKNGDYLGFRRESRRFARCGAIVVYPFVDERFSSGRMEFHRTPTARRRVSRECERNQLFAQGKFAGAWAEIEIAAQPLPLKLSSQLWQGEKK
jgi:hypothetical protein